MPNTKSAAKAMRGSKRKAVYNLRTKIKVRTTIKDTRRALLATDSKSAAENLQKAMSALDKAAKKGVIHKNTANRKKSRLSLALNKLQAK